MAVVRIQDSGIFVGADRVRAMRQFCDDNSVATFQRSNHWSNILQPFASEERYATNCANAALQRSGFTSGEVERLRDQLRPAMQRYPCRTDMLSNGFDDDLDVVDVLFAQQKLFGDDDDDESFQQFYRQAMQIEFRGTVLHEP
jgi:hypothetical protein